MSQMLMTQMAGDLRVHTRALVESHVKVTIHGRTWVTQALCSHGSAHICLPLGPRNTALWVAEYLHHQLRDGSTHKGSDPPIPITN